MTKDICSIKTIKDLIDALENVKNLLGEDTPVILSKDEEGNAYGDILMFGRLNVEDLSNDSLFEYFGDTDNPAVKLDGKNKNVLVIYPII